MDSAVTNLCPPGERVAVVVAGAFGERWAKLCAHYGLDVERIDYAWGEAPDPDEVGARGARERRRASSSATQSETSTGVVSRRPGDQGGGRRRDARRRRRLLARRRAARDRRVGDRRRRLRLAEGADVPARARDGGGRRAPLGRGCPPSRSFYFDWRATRKAQEVFDAAFTPAVSLIRGLDVALGMLLDEGLEAGVRAARAPRPRDARRSQGDGARALLARRRLLRGRHRDPRARGDRRARAAAPPARPARRHARARARGRSSRRSSGSATSAGSTSSTSPSALAALELALTELGAEIERGVAVTRRVRGLRAARRRGLERAHVARAGRAGRRELRAGAVEATIQEFPERNADRARTPRRAIGCALDEVAQVDRLRLRRTGSSSRSSRATAAPTRRRSPRRSGAATARVAHAREVLAATGFEPGRGRAVPRCRAVGSGAARADGAASTRASGSAPARRRTWPGSPPAELQRLTGARAADLVAPR